MYDKPTANIILSDEKAESVSPKISNRTRMSLAQHSFGSPRHSDQRRQKKNPNWKRSETTK